MTLNVQDFLQSPLLELNRVEFGYSKNSDPLLKIAGFSLYPGESIGIIGDNGSGKSTIVKLLLGLQKPKPGSIVRLFGQEVSWKKHYPTLSYVGDPSYKPEELGLPANISVKEVINNFRVLLADRLDISLSAQLEDKLGLTNLYERSAGSLSKGERLRLMLFLALGKKPRLLIADEPTEGLDEESKKFILSLMRDISRQKQIGILWISHRYHEMLTIVEKIYELRKSDLHYVGKGGEFKFEIEADSIESNIIISSSEIFETFGKILIDPLTSNLKVLGSRASEDVDL